MLPKSFLNLTFAFDGVFFVGWVRGGVGGGNYLKVSIIKIGMKCERLRDFLYKGLRIIFIWGHGGGGAKLDLLYGNKKQYNKA